jgi:type IV pilus assembly protein PilC
MNMENVPLSAVLVGFVCAGILGLWAIRIRYDLRAPPDELKTMLQIVSWTCIGIGVFGLQVHLAVQVAPVMWLITLVIIITSMVRYRIGELRSFLSCLAAAAERGIPLDQAAYAFSLERGDSLGSRAERLAHSLQNGVPISIALPQLWRRVPFDVLLALRVGVVTGDLGLALKAISKPHDQTDHLLRAILEKVLYLAALTCILFAIFSFTLLKIVPVFERMFMDFEIELPAMTTLTISFGNLAFKYWYVPAPLFLLLLIMLAIGWLYYLYLLPRNLPLINRLSRRWDAALIMRSLGLAVRQKLPFEGMIGLLAVQYPSASVRTRLSKALQRMDRAEPWHTALWQAGLLHHAEAGLLSSAQRSGNLEWALNELADSAMRRLAYRIRIAMNIAFPTILLGYGIVLGFIVMSLFMPLVSLVMGLT